MQSPPDEFVCVPFHSAMMVATGLFIGSRKEQHQTKRLPASWGLCVGFWRRVWEMPVSFLFLQTSEVRFQNRGSTTWLWMPGTADSQNLGKKLTTGPSPSSSCSYVEGLGNFGPSEGLVGGGLVLRPLLFSLRLVGSLLSCCSEDMLSGPQRSR